MTLIHVGHSKSNLGGKLGSAIEKGGHAASKTARKGVEEFNKEREKLFNKGLGGLDDLLKFLPYIIGGGVILMVMSN